MKIKQMIRAFGILLCLVFLVWCMNTPPLREVAGDSVTESQEPPVSESEAEPSAEPDSEEVVESELEVVPESETEQAEPEVVEQEDEIITFTISATGDVSLGVLQTHDYKETFNEYWDKYGAEFFFENVKELFTADDMTIVNFEGVLTTSDNRVEKKYNINGKPEYVQVLTYGDVEAAAMGNNHRMDYGEEGLKDSLAALDGAGIVYGYDDVLGYYEDTEKGIKVGFVSVNKVYDKEKVEIYLEQGIATLKADETVDIIIACFLLSSQRYK